MPKMLSRNVINKNVTSPFDQEGRQVLQNPKT